VRVVVQVHQDHCPRLARNALGLVPFLDLLREATLAIPQAARELGGNVCAPPTLPSRRIERPPLWCRNCSFLHNAGSLRQRTRHTAAAAGRTNPVYVASLLYPRHGALSMPSSYSPARSCSGQRALGNLLGGARFCLGQRLTFSDLRTKLKVN
jgi:hypothetical protein